MIFVDAFENNISCSVRVDLTYQNIPNSRHIFPWPVNEFRHKEETKNEELISYY